MTRAICQPTAARWGSTRLGNGRRKGIRARGRRACGLRKPPAVARRKSSASFAPRDSMSSLASAGPLVRYIGPVRCLLSWLIIFASLASCQREDPVRVAMRARLKQESRLTPEEVRAFFDQIAPAIANKKVMVREGALARALDDRQRTSVLGMLSDPASVYDGGLRVDGKNIWRGLKTGGTAVLSELDATQTLWVDIGTFVPRRYEFEYSSPGFGDYAYDLTFDP